MINPDHSTCLLTFVNTIAQLVEYQTHDKEFSPFHFDGLFHIYLLNKDGIVHFVF